MQHYLEDDNRGQRETAETAKSEEPFPLSSILSNTVNAVQAGIATLLAIRARPSLRIHSHPVHHHDARHYSYGTQEAVFVVATSSASISHPPPSPPDSGLALAHRRRHDDDLDLDFNSGSSASVFRGVPCSPSLWGGSRSDLCNANHRGRSAEWQDEVCSGSSPSGDTPDSSSTEHRTNRCGCSPQGQQLELLRKAGLRPGN